MAVKTINLTGAEVAVTGLDGAHAHITNMGADIIYAAKSAGISPGADGVVPIPAGNGNTLRGISGAVYLSGTGSVLIQSDDYVQPPSFRNSTASGGSGVDDIARAAVNEHAGNAEIHVTTDEKAVWNAKADLSDIPSSLPANGGNADTVGGKNAAEIMSMECGYDARTAISNSADIDEITQAGKYIVSSSSVAASLINSPFSSSGFYLDVYRRNDMLITQIALAWSGVVKIRSHNETGTWSEWQSFVKKSELDALAARVAALEGGTS